MLHVYKSSFAFLCVMGQGSQSEDPWGRRIAPPSVFEYTQEV